MIEKIKLDIVESSEKVDFKKLYQDVFIDVRKKIDRPPIALSMGTYEYRGNYYPIPIGSYGDFSCLVGASKSMKTYLKSAINAAYIGGNSNHYFPDLLGHENNNKFVFDLDTEQSSYHTQKVAQRTCNMVGFISEFYKPFSLREHDPNVRFEFIEWLMLESEFRNDIGLVAIDGVADLMENVNDLENSNKIVQSLMRWTTLSNSHIITILHRNHGSDKPAGHLGSAIMKKAETVAFVERSDSIVKVTPDYTRNIAFNEFTFTLDKDHLPIQCDSSSDTPW